MNRQRQIIKAKTLAQKYNNHSLDNIDEDMHIRSGSQTRTTTAKYQKSTQQQYQPRITSAIVGSDKLPKYQANLFDKINKMFDDPTIKNLKDFNHEEFLNKENTTDDIFGSTGTGGGIGGYLPPLPKHKTKSISLVSGKDVLDKAKQLLEKNKSEIPQMKEKQKQQIKKRVTIQEKQSKENTFVTGLGLYNKEQQEEEIEQVKQPIKEQEQEDSYKYEEDDDDEDDNDYDDLDGNEYLKQLQGEELDDLEELRRMIAKTKKDIQGYAGEVYSLKNCISDLNVGYKDTGYGLDDDLFTEIDREFNRYMPGGDTNKLFDDIGNKNRTSQAILSTASSKKNIHKGSFITSGNGYGTGYSVSSSTSSNNHGYSHSTSTHTPSQSRTSSSQGPRKPPIVRQPVLDKAYGTTKIPELQPISSNNKKQMRETFY